MSANKLKLILKEVKIPDITGDSLFINFTFYDQNNPLKDSKGNVQLSDKVSAEGNVLPQYYDFTITVPIEGEIPETEAEITALVNGAKAQAVELAKTKSQARVNGINKVDKVKTIIKALDKEELVYDETATPVKKAVKSKK